jgi:hypothetical protein
LGADETKPMNSSAFKIKDIELHRHGRFVTAVARWVSVGLGLVALFYLWDHPRTAVPCLTVGLSYLVQLPATAPAC